MAPGSPFGNFLTNQISYMANVLGQGRIPYVAPNATLKPKAKKPAVTSVGSDQLPRGAYMTEPGRVYGVDSEQVGRLGGYMDEMGRVFLPANNQVNPASWGAPSSLFSKPSPTTRPPASQPRTSGSPAAERAFEAEKARVAQLTAQDPELQRYERAAALARKSGATEQDVQAAEDIGMAMWAKANPKLAAKIKPGQSGYEVIQNELNAGQMGPVTNFPFDTTRPLSPTPIPPEQRAVTYEGVRPVSLEGVTPIVGGGFPTEQAAMFERFQQAIAPNKPTFQGSPLGTATPLVGNLSYTGSIAPLGTAVGGGDFRSEQARKLAEMFKSAQFSS